MLDKVDLSQNLNKSEFPAIMAELQPTLAALQRETIAHKIPVIVVFEGWGASGKGTLINRLMRTLDPRHFTVYPIQKPTDDEHFRPFLWRFWIKTPAKGRLVIFDRSWYRHVLEDRVAGTLGKSACLQAYQEINCFERQLADDNTVIIKFFLHISKKEQKNRFEKLAANKATGWRVTPEDWQKHKNRDKFFPAIEDMLTSTETRAAPWTVVEANDRRFASVKTFQTVINSLRIAIAHQSQNTVKSKSTTVKLEKVTTSVLDTIDLSRTVTPEEYQEDLRKLQHRIRELEHEVYARRIPVVIVYEGWDAAGKGGNIRRLTRRLDPRGYAVVPIFAPNDIEKKHHYLWRFWNQMPKAGHIAIFDRSWYGRVMVERVEGFCTEEEWRRAFQEINEMEQELVNFDTVLVKFWLQISKEEQLRRFNERKKSPDKQWKITDEDWRNREKWDLYREAVDEMLFRTSSSFAPWTIVESNCKRFARLKALKTVIRAIEKKLR